MFPFVSSPPGGASVIQAAIKLADETVTNDVTLSDDSDLILPVVAGEKYILEVQLFPISLSGTGDLKFVIKGPATDTVFYSWNVVNGSGDQDSEGDVKNDATSTITILMDSSSHGVHLNGAWFPTASGNLRVQWAQNTSSGSYSGLRASSWMKLTKVVS